MYVYNTTSLTEGAIKAVIRNLKVDHSLEEVRLIMMQKYPNLEGEIADIFNEMDNPEEYLVERKERPIKVNCEENSEEVKERKKIQRAQRSHSKLNKAKEIYKTEEDKSKNNVVKLFMDVLDLPFNTATCYYYTCRKTVS